MKVIQMEPGNSSTQFGAVAVGACFFIGGQVYMKTKAIRIRPANAVVGALNLETGECLFLNPSDMVYQLEYVEAEYRNDGEYVDTNKFLSQQRPHHKRGIDP